MNNPAKQFSQATVHTDVQQTPCKDQASTTAGLKQTSSNSEMALRIEILSLTDQLLSLLQDKFAADNPEIQHALGFLRYYLDYYLNDQSIALDVNAPKQTLSAKPGGLSRLIDGLKLGKIEVQLLVLAGMAQEHEGFADIFRSLHPTRQPYPTAALLSQIVRASESQRSELLQNLATSPLITTGIVCLFDDAPVLTCSVKVSAADWQAIKSAVAQPNLLIPQVREFCSIGLDKWLDSNKIKQARHCLQCNLSSILYLQNPDIDVVLNRAYVLAQREKRALLAVAVSAKPEPQAIAQLGLHCLVSGSVPLLVVESNEASVAIELSHLARFCQCIMICTHTEILLKQPQLITLDLPIERLNVSSLVSMWRQLLPEFADQAQQLANRFPLEPSQAQQRIHRLKTLNAHATEGLTLDCVITGLKQPNNEVLPQGIKRISPRLGWQDLVLPEMQQAQLQGAIQRLVLQHTVLDEWQFLHNRRGAKGVRLLFSGAPGTGKTLSAEVLAHALQVDLLIVDLAAVVSKWIGETEKNLAKVFSFAEQSQALLFFDEADAIFGKRTEVSDSHDRYANLETAYLLTRLEAYEGMAILATNFRNNIDAAFIRRLDYIIDFREPNKTDRERLWRCHVPDRAPLSDNVDFAHLAALFPMVGGEIRNAAVAAAYFAAQQQQSIQQDHFISAIRAEYEKTGKAFREVNPF